MPPTPQPAVSLRPVRPDDLPTLYAFQCDPESARMAMVIPRSRESFDAIWNAVLANPQSTARVILYDGTLVGSIGTFQSDGVEAVGYAVARPYWGRGIATRALALLLAEVKQRPIHARAASTNAASIQILLKNGFTITGRHHSPATERYLECEEVHFLLAGAAR